MTDIWGYCPGCSRWFYADTTGSPTVERTCPVCATPAASFTDLDDQAQEVLG